MYKIPQLRKFPKLFHAFSTKADGNMANVILGENVDFDKALENRKNFLEKIDIDINSCVCMWVKGEDGVAEANLKDAGISMKDYKKAVKIDALITNKKNLFIFLLTADCAPVIIYDPVKEVIGVVHIGWKGADLNIVSRVISGLREKYESKVEDLIVSVGPSAREKSYTKVNPSQKNKAKWKGFVRKVGKKKYAINFVGLCKKQLVGCGVKKGNIFDCNVDTVKDGRFFSHYREKELGIDGQGRFACVVGLK